MIQQSKPQIETVEEWMKRTKRKPKLVDFRDAHKPIQEFVRNVKKKRAPHVS